MRALSILLGALLCLVIGPAYGATTLLPNGKQCFSNANGALVAGTVNMFFPSTTTPKPTWKDSTQSSLNTQPIVLDSNGCAVIYGVGTYRQQVFDVNGALQWDQLTTDTSAYNAVFWAGLSGGTPNVITITDTGFNATDGSVINFVALQTNTGATTINPSGFGAISVVKDTTAGPVALTGGEIIQNNIISVVYYAVSNTFHLLNAAVQSASGANAPLCGASNLQIASSGSGVTVSASQAVTQNGQGLVLNRSSVGATVNITLGTSTSTAGGMDGESPGTSSWIYIWLIDNGSAISGLASLASGNGLSPVLPSGYTYKCRVGAARVGAGGSLVTSNQRGTFATYTGPVQITSGSFGSISSPTYIATSTAAVVPPSASAISLIGVCGTASAAMIVAPNSGYGAFASTGANAPPMQVFANAAGAVAANQYANLLLESTNIFAASNCSLASLNAYGWTDQVNAN